MILEAVKRAQEVMGLSLKEVLEQLGIPSATYHRWRRRAERDCLNDRVVIPRRKAFPPTPEEVTEVCWFALTHTDMGYKRLTWQMVDEDIAYLRPYQVYQVLDENDLLCRRNRPNSEALRKPPEPDHPDQVWHIDLMYVYIRPRWYYLVDILDGYSRFLVNWSLNLTMTADTVTVTVQEALENLEMRLAGEPRLVHDHGSQFVSAEWRAFIEALGLQDIKIRVSHPESNGRLERLHRTHREEGLPDMALSDYHQAVEELKGWDHYYNYRRPHSALNYLCPIDYYRGKPAERLAERERKLKEGVERRRVYWETMGKD